MENQRVSVFRIISLTRSVLVAHRAHYLCVHKLRFVEWNFIFTSRSDASDDLTRAGTAAVRWWKKGTLWKTTKCQATQHNTQTFEIRHKNYFVVRGRVCVCRCAHALAHANERICKTDIIAISFAQFLFLLFFPPRPNYIKIQFKSEMWKRTHTQKFKKRRNERVNNKHERMQQCNIYLRLLHILRYTASQELKKFGKWKIIVHLIQKYFSEMMNELRSKYIF